jgi:quinol monooxygenase YgiN
MYGTVARMRVKPGMLEKLQQIAQAESNMSIPGYMTQAVFQMDGDPNEIYLAVIFDSKESYFANANSPEQNQRFQEMMTYIAAETEWHDGKVIFAHHI